jgi:hypothetical protein
MADGFIVRRGGKAEEVLRTATPDINFVSKTQTEIVVTFKNNDAGEVEIYYGLTAPLTDTVTLATGATSSNITFSGLASDTQFTVSAYALVTDPTSKKIKSEIVSTNITTDAALEYGVQWTQSTDTVIRLDDAVGLSRSDFDTIEPFASMRRCMVNDDKTINYYIDPSDPTKIGEVVNTGSYTTGNTAVYTGADGQVMVEIPKFFYKTAEPTSGVYQWYVSMGQPAGYSVHPAFVTGANTRDKIYISAFEASSATESGTLQSISGVQPRAFRTINQFRTQAQARGTGWQMQTYRLTQAIQVLYLIEYADFDSQTTIGKGYVEAAGGTGNESLNTGATISLGNTSGSPSGGTDGLKFISYRGIENFWGNIFTYVDGFNIEGNNKAYIANDSFESNKFTSPYVLEGTMSSSDGFVTNILFPEFLATAVGGSSTSHLHDEYLQNTGNRVALFGGNWQQNVGRSGCFHYFLFDDINASWSPRSSGSRISIL